jgi:quaternary ammonium compound-resistance protein SugE
MAWIYLIMAGLFEIGWPVGFKIAQSGSNEMHIFGISMAVICMSISGYLLYMAQKAIPLGTAYAIWTGIGAVGTFFIGVLVFSDPSSLMRYVGVALIILGVITLKLASSSKPA